MAISVSVYEPLIDLLKRRMDAACLKRDSYLDRALRVEAEFLKNEIATPNSDKAKNYIFTQLKKLKLKQINLSLSQETIDAINSACEEKNISRDVFINRFLLLLTASDEVLNACFSVFSDYCYSETISDYMKDSSIDDFHSMTDMQFVPYYTSNALDAIEEFITQYSPFIRIRAIINKIIDDYGDEEIRIYHNAMYSFPFSMSALQNLSPQYKLDNSLGFNPFMTDEDIKLNEEADKMVNELQRMIDETMQKEKQTRAEKARQMRAKKTQAKSEGEAK